VKPTRCNNHTLGNARCVREYDHAGICSFSGTLHAPDSRDAELRALRAVRDAAERMSDQIGDYGEDEVCTCGLPDDTNDEMMCAFHFRASELRAALRAAKGVTG